MHDLLKVLFLELTTMYLLSYKNIPYHINMFNVIILQLHHSYSFQFRTRLNSKLWGSFFKKLRKKLMKYKPNMADGGGCGGGGGGLALSGYSAIEIGVCERRIR